MEMQLDLKGGRRLEQTIVFIQMMIYVAKSSMDRVACVRSSDIADLRELLGFDPESGH